MTTRTGLLGGTFDPIHFGHLDAAETASRVLALDRVLLVPSHLPPHRPLRPHASPFHRFAMTALASLTRRRFVASDVELQEPGPSYTAQTLRRVRETLPHGSQLFFIVGADAFAEIPTWMEYPALLDLAHFAVVSRPGRPVDALRERLPELAPRMVAAGEGATGADFDRNIVLVEAETADVSSSEIRRRLAAGEPIAGLVPTEVETHIARHQLYSTHDSAGGLHDQS